MDPASAAMFQTSAMPTNAAQVQQLPAGTQYGIDQAMMKKALAQALIAKGSQQPQGQTIQTGGGAPNRYVAPSITQHLSDMASMYVGANALSGSMRDMANVMQSYQAANNDVEQRAAAALDGSADGARNAYTIRANSMIPAQQEKAEKMYPYIAALTTNERDTNAKMVEAARGMSAEPNSVVAAATAAGGPNPTLINQNPPPHPAGPVDPNNPDTGSYTGQTGNPIVSPVSGQVVGTKAGSGEPIGMGEGLPAKQKLALQQTDSDVLTSNLKQAPEMYADAMKAAYAAKVAAAYKYCVQRANTGALVTEKTDVQQLSSLLGVPVSPKTSFTQLGRSLGMTIQGMTRETGGFGGRVANQEQQIINQASGSNLGLQTPVLQNIADIMENYGVTKRAVHNGQMADFSNHALHHGLTVNPFTPYIITDDKIPPVPITMNLIDGGGPNGGGGPAIPSHRRTFNPDGTPAQ